MTTVPHKRFRSSTGCKTCRRRHVKCDESKPTCKNCGKKNRVCRYDTPPNKNPQKPIATPIHAEHSDENISDHDQSLQISRGDAPCSLPAPGDGPSVRDDSPPRLEIDSFDDANVTGPPLNSAATPVSPFSATLESILLQAGIDAGINNLHNNEVHESEAALPSHPQSYIDPYLSLSEQPEFITGTAPIAPHHLIDEEVRIFRNYVEVVSKWVDSFSHDQPFHRLVPVLALRCPFLLHACLALSSKQMILVGTLIHESTTLRYYRLALRAISDLLVDSQYAQSDELLAACIILSTYEMIDVVGESLGSHLKGVASLLQTRQIDGNMFGIRGACYWTWYRHEIWASLQTGRRLSLDEKYWRPPQLDAFDSVTVENIANRVLFIYGQCINFCNDHEQHGGCDDQALQTRHHRAVELEQALDEWKAKLPTSMSSFHLNRPDHTSNFPSLWFIFPQSAIAHQVYHASKIILALHRPSSPLDPPQTKGLGHLASLSLRRHIEFSREQIFLTANAGIADAWSLVSAQCLYVAGLVTDGIQERRKTLELIDGYQRSSGRKTCSIADELRTLWKYEDT